MNDLKPRSAKIAEVVGKVAGVGAVIFVLLALVAFGFWREGKIWGWW